MSKKVNHFGNTVAVSIAPAILSETKLDFRRKLKRAQEEYNISNDLIIKFDQMSLAYICGSNRKLEFQGTTSVKIAGKGKKTDIWAIYGY